MNKSSKDVIIVGVALFAMFFGAGNLIFPPFMGLMAGTSWPLALAGFLITGIGLPLLGIMATAKAGGTSEHLAGRVSPLFGIVFSIILLLAAGPFLAIPRTGATAFEMAIRPLTDTIHPAFFSIVFFAVTLAFALNRSTVIDKIGRYLTPILFVTLAWIIIEGIFYPLATIENTSLQQPFSRGFNEGYQTMDTIASLIFAQIVIGTLVLKGYAHHQQQVTLTALAGLIAASGLGLIYGGLMYLGATASAIYPQTIERTELLIAITQSLLGPTGKIALGIAVALACLTTAIGLTATVADYFSTLFKNKVSYFMVCVVTVVFSGIFATVGVTTIVSLAVPFLIMIYPVAICLILLTLIGASVAYRAVYVGAVTGALAVSIFEALSIAGMPIETINNLIALIPLANAGFAWLVPGLTGAVVGMLLARAGIGAKIS